MVYFIIIWIIGTVIAYCSVIRENRELTISGLVFIPLVWPIVLLVDLMILGDIPIFKLKKK